MNTINLKRKGFNASIILDDGHQRTSASCKPIPAMADEFLAADRYVLGVPMHNLSLPSTFKAYIDQIVRKDCTYVVEGSSFSSAYRRQQNLYAKRQDARQRTLTVQQRIHNWVREHFSLPKNMTPAMRKEYIDCPVSFYEMLTYRGFNALFS